jgi:DNA-binding beta-propeller fold protein YncE
VTALFAAPSPALADGPLIPAGCAEAFGLSDVRDLVVSPDGKSVYVADPGSQAILKFDRLPNGTLAQAGCVNDRAWGRWGTCVPADGVASSRSIVVSPDGRSVYAASQELSTIAGKRVLSMKGKRFKVTRKLAKGRYVLKLTVLGADGQTANDTAKLTVR